MLKIGLKEPEVTYVCETGVLVGRDLCGGVQVWSAEVVEQQPPELGGVGSGVLVPVLKSRPPAWLIPFPICDVISESRTVSGEPRFFNIWS